MPDRPVDPPEDRDTPPILPDDVDAAAARRAAREAANDDAEED